MSIYRDVHMLCTFLCLLICMCVPFAPVFVRAGEEYLNIYIYIHMLPHDQKRNMNMVDFFFWGGYQVTIQIYPCTCAICFVSCDYIWIYCNSCIYACTMCILGDVYVQYVSNLELSGCHLRRRSNGRPME